MKEENAVTVINDPDVEALLSECDLSNSLKENTSKGVDGSNMFLIRNQNLKEIEIASHSVESKEDNEYVEYLNMNALRSSSTTINARNSMKLESVSQENVEKKNNKIEMASHFLEMQKFGHDSTHADSSVDLHSNMNKYVDKDIVEEMVQPETSFVWANSDSKEEQLDEFMKDSIATTVSSLCVQIQKANQYYVFTGNGLSFGRLINGGISESCCVIVKNIWRQLLVNEKQTDKVDLMQVNEEVQKILRSMGVKVVKCRPCEKKFAYNDGVVPRSAEVLEVHYSFNDPRLAVDLSGETFSHVFNTTANAMERLLIETNMKGPSWIEISGFNVSSVQVTYVKHEFTVDMERMKSISIIDCSDSPPDLNLLTMNIITTVNHKKENEIVSISCIFDRRCTTTNPTLNRNFLERFCILAKPTLSAYPFDLKTSLKQVKLDTIVYETANEHHLLNYFLSKLQSLDPDAYAGHDLAAQFALLSSRLEKLGIAHWSRLGRLKRSFTIKQATHMKTSQWELTAGRLVLDSRLSAMELIKMRSYDLSDLSLDLLGINHHFTVNQDISAHFV
ncbi:DNA polymerase [Dirofilaria immitis]|nr:DNA polymerase [Dirofilaria immitis]